MTASSTMLDNEAQGFMPKLITRLFFRRATVIENKMLSRNIHLITLQGDALRGVTWSVGDKVQLRMGNGLATRTYTPMSWDAINGITQFLAHSFTAGPGSKWVENASVGQDIELMGPRSSLKLSAIDAKNSVLIGDETAIGLAAAWQSERIVLEVNNPAETQNLIDALGVPACLVGREENNAHFRLLVAHSLNLTNDSTNFALVGRAVTVKYLHRMLREHDIDSKRIVAKVYWADDRAGLD